MIDPSTLSFISALCISPTLVVGAICDIQNRTFPKSLWSVTGKVGMFSTILMYLVLLSYQQYNTVIGFLLISTVLSLVFWFLALRYGSGGDYRALIYIALVTPSLAIITTVFSLVLGLVQVAMARYLGSTAPWAVGICIAFGIACYMSFVQGITLIFW